jgi:hypothetical protein
MYPVGSNGASQAILDARSLADRLSESDHAGQALWAYERERLPMTAQIVQSNRSGGPEGVIDAVEQRAPDGFDNIDNVLSYEAAGRGCAAQAGFAKEQVNRASKIAWRPRRRRVTSACDRNDVGWVLLFHRVDRPKQIIELARRCYPEKTFENLVGLIKQPVRDAHGQLDQDASSRGEFLAINQRIHAPFQHINECVLRRMYTWRKEVVGARRTRRMMLPELGT